MLTEEDIIPFGKKYHGQKLKEVPDSYLDWAYEQIRPIAYNKRSWSQAALVKYIEHKRREKQQNEKTPN